MEYFFTVDEANQKIPWLEDQLKSVISLVNNIDRIKLELNDILQNRRSNGHSDTDQEVTSRRKETGAEIDRLTNLVKEINTSGVILKDIELGLVDFPTLCEGREIYLCWHLGEPRINFWHETDVGFSGRQPLT